MREKWIVRLLVDRDPDVETTPDEWDWGDAQVLYVDMVGIVAPEPEASE